MLFESANVFLMPGSEGDEVARRSLGFPIAPTIMTWAPACTDCGPLMRREASGGWIVQTSEPQFTITGLRRFLNGEPQRPVHPDFGKAIVDGRGLEDVSAEQLDDFLFGPENLGQ